MFSNFFFSLKKAEIPVSLKEYLTFLDAVKHGVAEYSLNDFYYLSRSSLVKDERHIDRFDQVFGHCFKGLELLDEVFGKEIPEEWLQSLAQLHLTPEEKKEIEALGGWEKLMETLKQRLEEQKSAIKEAINGLVQLAVHLLERMVITQRVLELDKKQDGRVEQLKFGINENIKTSMTLLKSE